MIITLKNSAIRTSYIGIGTSAAYDGAVCPAKIPASEYLSLLPYAFDRGISLWDTSLTYGTHDVVKQALKIVGRHNITLCTKTIEMTYKQTLKAVEVSLKELGTDYIDIFFLQGMRNKYDFILRKGAWEALCLMKHKGYIRAIGIASHGLGALQQCLHTRPDVLLARVNYSGHLMDSNQDDIKSVIAGIPLLKKACSTLLPKSMFQKIASSVQKGIVSTKDREDALRLIKQISEKNVDIIGMKILGEGNLVFDVQRAISYVKGLNFIDAILLGCCSKDEIDEAIAISL